MPQCKTSCRTTQGALAAASVFLVLACKTETPPAIDTAGSSTEGQPAAPAPATGTTQPVVSATAKCPAGRWSYDYSDQALEVLMKNAVGAKVLKEAGSFVCTVPEGTEGTIVCETQGAPVENVVEANQAGMKMTISVTIDGKASTHFTTLDAQNMKVVSSDTSGLKIGTTVTLGGKQMPFPADQLIGIFGKSGSTLGYKCEGGKLYLKPHVENVETVWQELEPVN